MASTTPQNSLPSHKRTSSTAENTITPPEPKRQAQDTSIVPKQYVYIVMIESAPQYSPEVYDIHGVYSTVKDANNAVIGIVDREYAGSEDCSRGMYKDGRVHWHGGDVGEGESVSITVKKMEVRPPGSEPEREWEDDGAQDEGVEGGEFEDEDEEDEEDEDGVEDEEE